MRNYFMLACQNIKKELMISVEEAGSDFPILFIPAELHMFPDKLREYLQNTIDSLENVDFILLPMGMCGNGTLGLTSKKASIVLPKCGDCIDLLISDISISNERPECSYFLTESWLGQKFSVDTEYEYTVGKYGHDRASTLINMIYKDYKFFTFLDTGTYDLNLAKQRVKPLAQAVNMDINDMKGGFFILRKMARLDFDEDFIIVPPGTAISGASFDI